MATNDTNPQENGSGKGWAQAVGNGSGKGWALRYEASNDNSALEKNGNRPSARGRRKRVRPKQR